MILGHNIVRVFFIIRRSSARRLSQSSLCVIKRKLYPNPIVTQLLPATTWYKAEAYHQRYFANNPAQGYCQFVVAPKVAKFRKQFFSRLKT